MPREGGANAGSRVVMGYDAPGRVDTVRYLHADHIGSIDVVTDASGAVVERLSFSPFGERRAALTWDDPLSPILPPTPTAASPTTSISTRWG